MRFKNSVPVIAPRNLSASCCGSDGAACAVLSPQSV